jgi:hypothetical protein
MAGTTKKQGSKAAAPLIVMYVINGAAPNSLLRVWLSLKVFVECSVDSAKLPTCFCCCKIEKTQAMDLH